MQQTKCLKRYCWSSNRNRWSCSWLCENLAATAIEAKDRASESHEVIGLFGLVKMLKDPQVQNVFRFVNAFLQVNAERKAK